jgi:integrase
MRIREALGLRWEDVDLDEATIRLRWQLAKDDRRRVPVKTAAGTVTCRSCPRSAGA